MLFIVWLFSPGWWGLGSKTNCSDRILFLIAIIVCFLCYKMPLFVHCKAELWIKVLWYWAISRRMGGFICFRLPACSTPSVCALIRPNDCRPRCRGRDNRARPVEMTPTLIIIHIHIITYLVAFCGFPCFAADDRIWHNCSCLLLKL